MINVSWDFFKQWALLNKKLLFQEIVDTGDVYNLIAADGPIVVSCRIKKDEEPYKSPEQMEYETTYQPLANKQIDYARDADGAQITNPKLAGEGTNYQATFIDFKTSDPLSMGSCDWAGQPLTISSIEIFDSSGNELEAANKSQAVCTVLTVSQTKDFYIQGFTIIQPTRPLEKVVLCAAFAPHIPKEYGGQKEVIQGCNLLFAPFGNREIDWVGDSASEIKFDTVYNSHVMALKLFHPPGYEHQLQCEVIWYV